MRNRCYTGKVECRWSWESVGVNGAIWFVEAGYRRWCMSRSSMVVRIWSLMITFDWEGAISLGKSHSR